MPLSDPFEQAQFTAPVGKGEGNKTLIDPFEGQRPDLTAPEGPEIQTQFIPSSIEAAQKLDSFRQSLADRSGLSEFSIENSLAWDNLKPAIVAGGATLGAATGAPLGPVGMLVGGALGAGMAQAAIGAGERQSIEEQISLIAKEMRDEALFAGGAMAIGPAIKILGPSVGKIFGLNEEGIKQLVKDAERNKIPFALQDVVGESAKRTGKLMPSMAAGYPKVIGVFPFVGAPQRKALYRTEKALQSSVNQTLNQVAPNMTLSNLGIDVVDAAKKSSKQFKAIASGLYDNFYNLADDLGQPKIIPTRSIKSAIANLRASKGRPTVVTESGVKKPLKQPKIAADFDNYIDELSGIADDISPAEIRAIEEDLNRFEAAANIKGYDIKQLAVLKQATEIAKQDLDVSKVADPIKAGELRTALDTANRWYSAGMTLFQSPAGKKFQKVDKNIFNSKFFKAGGISPDQFGREIVKSSTSPQMIQSFRNIVGQKQINNVARQFIDDAVSNSMKENVLDFSALERNLKLNSKSGIEVADELFKGTGISREKIQSLINVGKVHDKVELVDAATYLKRRLMLGGIGSIGFMVHPVKFTTVTVPALILARGGSKFLADPKILRWMTTALDDTVNDKIRRVAASQLLDKYLRYENTMKEDEAEGRIDKEKMIGESISGESKLRGLYP